MPEGITGWEKFLAFANVASAVAVAVFAWLQWKIILRNEETRQKERREDELTRRDSAYAILQAEWFRIWTVSERWRKADLIDLAVARQLRPDDIAPRDWGTATAQLGDLGVLGARLGSYGFAFANDALVLAHAFQSDVEAYFENEPEAAKERDTFEATYMPQLRVREARLKELATEAANILQDALDHAPTATLLRTEKFRPNLRSKHAKAIAGRLEAQSVNPPKPSSPEDWKIVVKE